MEKEQKDDEYLYGVVRNYYLMNSKTFHCFPDESETKRDLRVLLGDNLDEKKIDFKKIRTDVVKQRVDEIFKEEGDATQKKINDLLGVGIWRYMKDLGYESFSDLRYDYLDKDLKKKFRSKKEAKNALRVCKKFVTKGEALKAFKSETKASILREDYENKGRIQSKVGASIQNYDINWKKEVLYPVYIELILRELESNPNIGDRELKKKYSFTQTYIKNQGGLIIFKLKNNIPINKRAENMLLRKLILQAVKPKPKTATTEEYIWDFIKKKTGKAYDTFRIPKEIEYLKHIKKIEGDKLKGGYWKTG